MESEGLTVILAFVVVETLRHATSACVEKGVLIVDGL